MHASASGDSAGLTGLYVQVRTDNRGRCVGGGWHRARCQPLARTGRHLGSRKNMSPGELMWGREGLWCADTGF